MLRPKHSLEEQLTTIFNNLEDAETKQKYYVELEEKYNIPIDMSSDIISGRKYLSEYNTFILYAITDVVASKQIEKSFTKKEIDDYSKQKFKPQKIGSTIKLPMFQVDTDQWIGASSVKFLMQLRDAQMINYNADTQRALQIMVSGGKEIYRPSVDYKAVNQITEAYTERKFIPNTISLNISLDDEDIDLSFEDNILTIKNLKAFDIFDGYHRYLAMGINYDKDHDFDYPTELRITNFSINKAKQFIFQEDHKTKMKRVDAASFDQFNPGNLVIERLNTDPTFDLRNSIDIKGGKIHAGILSAALNRWYFNTKRKIERKDIIRVTRDIKQQLNDFVEVNEEYLDKKWEKFEIWTIVYGLYKQATPEEIMSAINKLTEEQIEYLSRDNIQMKQENLIKEVY